MTRSKGRATTSGSSASANPEIVAAPKEHFVLQGKGRVGKTFAASLLAQYYLEQGAPLICLDTDPVNGSVSAIRARGARDVGLLPGDHIDVESRDDLVQRALTEDAYFVIDNGAASFLPSSRYLAEHDIAGLIAASGRRVAVHTILTGGPSMLDTAKMLEAVVE
jgi:cellulose biosynthesis protein BcsQ